MFKLKGALTVLFSMSLVSAFLTCTVLYEQMIVNAQEEGNSIEQPLEVSLTLTWCNPGATPIYTRLYVLNNRNRYRGWKNSEEWRPLKRGECSELVISRREITDSMDNVIVQVYQNNRYYKSDRKLRLSSGGRYEVNIVNPKSDFFRLEEIRGYSNHKQKYLYR
jgi:hypothetical protein